MIPSKKERGAHFSISRLKGRKVIYLLLDCLFLIIVAFLAMKVWICAVILLCAGHSGSVTPEIPRKCAGLPDDLDFSKRTISSSEEGGDFWTYHPANASLTLDLSAILYLDDESCLDETQTVSYFKLDLIALSNKRAVVKTTGRRCRMLPKTSLVQSSAVLNSTHPTYTFNYVQGLYYVRLSLCHFKDGICVANLRRIICSDVRNFKALTPKNNESCDFTAPANLTVNITNKKPSAWAFYLPDEGSVCQVEVRAVVPLCTAHQDYDTLAVAVVRVGLNEQCSFDDTTDYLMGAETPQVTGNGSRVDVIKLQPDNGSHLAYFEHDIPGLWVNSSYCLFFRPNNPHCRGEYGCLFYTQALQCGMPGDSAATVGVGGRFKGLQDIVAEPVFIGVVSLTLFLSLSLLMWTVVQCSKGKQNGGTPLMSSAQALKKAPPRSLTEDDLEHISRLPSQEIVLVYFPDTKRFKDLNRKMRDWLMTLDVNDVKDIYDEKCSEDVLKNPEQWVKDTLGGPEKRIILVCSRLAYECLSSVKRKSLKGPLSPRFVETDPHFGLLTRAIAYIEREMRGNYRNLICVRYEDIKICARQYSSEAFNIVPGTEYVLPQHLEDVYRWIHPRNPRPECWSENRPEVKDLLDAMRQYRNHDDNIFTVQFSSATLVADITPPPLLQNEEAALIGSGNKVQ